MRRPGPISGIVVCLALAGAAASAPGQITSEGRALIPPTATEPATGPSRAESIVAKLLGHPETAAPKPEAATLSDEQVLESIRKGTEFLLTQIEPELLRLDKEAERARNAKVQNFPENGKGLGPLMMITYTLLHLGQQIDDPRLRFNSDTMRPLVTLATDANVDFNYTTSLQACAIAQLPAKPEYKKAMQRVTAGLTGGLHKSGGYTYLLSDGPRGTRTDNSNSQYGLLGVWAAADWGIETPNSYWQVSDRFWRSMQCRDGGWDYERAKNSTPSMTAAGVASLYVCQEYIDTPVLLEPKPDLALERGLADLANKFDPTSIDLYYLYGVERAGLASGLKTLNGHNWYREAAAHIITMQQPNGSFSGKYNGSEEIPNTCYAVLFLIRGRAPVLINKLQYRGPWNARPRDAANLASYFSKSFEKHINWQVVGLDVSADDWMDAPVLLITGSRDPNFREAEVEKLRQFIRAGGMVFSVADGGKPAFTDAMKKYAALIGGNEYEMRVLPPEHPLFSMEAKVKNPPEILGLSNGVRELWVHATDDYGAAWQARKFSKTDAWDIATNMYFYASGRAGLRSKLQPLTVLASKDPPTDSASIARLEFAGNWNPEPGAWERMAKLMAARKTELAVSTVKVADLAAVNDAPNVAHLTGTGPFTLKDEEIAGLKKYVEGGGTLVIEAAGGSETFAASGQELIKQLWPNEKLALLPTDSEIYTMYSPQVAAIKEVAFRKFWVQTHGGTTSPRLQGLKLNGRLAVIFSAEDFSSGLLGTNTWGIGGYNPASAEAIARNIVLYPARGKFDATTAPNPATSPATNKAP